MKLFSIMLITALLLSCNEGGNTNKDGNTGRSFTQDELLVIYGNAYLKGRLNQMKCTSEEESQRQWEQDSLNIINVLFK